MVVLISWMMWACCMFLISIRPVRLAYKPYFFSQRTAFFSHNKSANGIFTMAYQPSEQGNIVCLDMYIICQIGITLKAKLLHWHQLVQKWVPHGLVAWSPCILMSFSLTSPVILLWARKRYYPEYSLKYDSTIYIFNGGIANLEKPQFDLFLLCSLFPSVWMPS